MSILNEHCGTGDRCRYYAPFPELDHGQCRRHAPVIVTIERFDSCENLRHETDSAFPTTGERDWCGDWGQVLDTSLPATQPAEKEGS
jgi:hypothetical protein